MASAMNKRPIPEEEAEEELDGIFHEIRQVLRVSGANLNFRTWATYPKFFRVLWDAIRPVAETRLFEESSDQLRALAARLAENLLRWDAATSVGLGKVRFFKYRRLSNSIITSTYSLFSRGKVANTA